MSLLITIVGALIIAMGLVFMINTAWIRPLMDFFSKGKRIYIAAGVRLALGVLFIYAASYCQHKRIILVLGLLFLATGIFNISANLEKQKKFIEWWKPKPDYVFSLLGLFAIIIGLLIIYGAVVAWPS